MAGINVLYYCPIWYWYEEEELFREKIGKYIKELWRREGMKNFFAKHRVILFQCAITILITVTTRWYGHGSIQRFFTTVAFTTHNNTN